MLPAIEAALAAEERTNSMSILMPVAAALAEYRAEHGEYPQKLEELVPGILQALPVDLFQAQTARLQTPRERLSPLFDWHERPGRRRQQ